jgi:hypothetical protein
MNPSAGNMNIQPEANPKLFIRTEALMSFRVLHNGCQSR